MCLIVFAWQQHADHQLILAGNRDEQYARPTQEMHWWPDRPQLLAGRDLRAGGTWLAIGRNGRFATVTNYREVQHARAGRRSRGELVSAFVDGAQSAAEFCDSIERADYAGFSLLLADRNELWYTSNRDDNTRELEPGVYGLANAALDTPWPKLTRCREALRALVAHEAINPPALFTLLADTRPARVAEIEDDELPFPIARAVSAPFIRSGDYGTRCTSVLLVDRDDRIFITERRFNREGQAAGDSEFRFATDR